MRWKQLALFAASSPFWLSACLPKAIPAHPGDPAVGVRIISHGHSCFTLQDSVGRTVVIDPYDDTVGYGRLQLRADALLISHEHFDHNEKSAVRPRVRDLELVASTGTLTVAGGMPVTEVASDHDGKQGDINGPNRLISFEMSGLRFVHLGDLGQDRLTDEQIRGIGRPDVVFVPVGGVVTLDAARAKRVVEQLKPRFVFPMHYGRSRFYTLDPVDEFLALFPSDQIVRLSETSVQIKLSDAANAPRIFVLTPTLRND